MYAFGSQMAEDEATSVHTYVMFRKARDRCHVGESLLADFAAEIVEIEAYNVL
jgi:hypothetical protein